MIQTTAFRESRSSQAEASDSASIHSLVSDRGCHPFTACRAAPAVATLGAAGVTTGLLSPVYSLGQSPPTGDSLFSLERQGKPDTPPELCLQQLSQKRSEPSCFIAMAACKLQFLCPKPDRSGESKFSRPACGTPVRKKRMIGTPPPNVCGFSKYDSPDASEEEYDDDDDNDNLDDTDDDLFEETVSPNSSYRRARENKSLHTDDDTVFDIQD